MRRSFKSPSGTSISWLSHMRRKGSHLVHLCCIIYPALKIASDRWKHSTSVLGPCVFPVFTLCRAVTHFRCAERVKRPSVPTGRGNKQKMLPCSEQDTSLFSGFHFSLQLSWVTFLLTQLNWSFTGTKIFALSGQRAAIVYHSLNSSQMFSCIFLFWCPLAKAQHNNPL